MLKGNNHSNGVEQLILSFGSILIDEVDRVPGLLQREVAVGVVAENRRQEGTVLVDPDVERTPMHREVPLWVMSDEHVIDDVGKKLGR